MELLARTNKHKLLFILSLGLALLTAYSAYSFFTLDRQLPTPPRTQRRALHEGDEQLGRKMSPLDFATFWNFGARDPFQPPNARINATAYFTFTEQNNSILVSGVYECKTDGRLDRVAIEYPEGWVFQPPASADASHRQLYSEDLQRSVEIVFNNIKQNDFQFEVGFTMPIRRRRELEFPEIKLVDAASENGFIGVRDTTSYSFKPETVEQLEAVAPPSQLRGADKAFEYKNHPYKLVLGLERVTVAASGYFTITEQGGNLVVRGGYSCKPNGKVQTLRIEHPGDWAFRAPRGSRVSYSTSRKGTTGYVDVTLRSVQQDEFSFPLEFTISARNRRQIDFPAIRIADAETESGFIGIRSTEACKIEPGNIAQLQPEAEPPPQLGGTDTAYRYASHPYQLALGITTTGPPPPDNVPPPPPPTNGGITPPDDGTPYEMPFVFGGWVTIGGERRAWLKDKTTGQGQPIRTGQVIDDVQVISISADKIVVRDPQGNRHELKSSQDFD